MSVNNVNTIGHYRQLLLDFSVCFRLDLVQMLGLMALKLNLVKDPAFLAFDACYERASLAYVAAIYDTSIRR